MKGRPGIFTRILLCFGLFALGLALVMGIFAYFTATSLSHEFLAKRAGLVLHTLMEAEKHARSDEETQLDAKGLVSSLEMNFLVGKQVPEKWANLKPGLHFPKDQNMFVLLEKEDGISYALRGPASFSGAILANIGSMFILCGAAGLAAGCILAFFLARRLASPLKAMAKALKTVDPGKAPPIPPAILREDDELGTLARAIRAYQANAQEALATEKFFASAASHELRTPLAILFGGLEILENRSDGNPAMADTIKRLLRTTRDMNLTVDALLCLARRENPQLSRIDPASTLARVLRDFTHGLAENAGKDSPVTMVTTRGKIVRINSSSGAIPANEDLLAIILRNLVENALIHGAGSEVSIALTHGAIVMTNRIGAEKISPGTGFGLTITRKACERMNWRLSHWEKDGNVIFRVEFASSPRPMA